jgi:phage terminase large subunit
MQATAAEASNPANRPYRPQGAALELLRSRDREVVLSGPAGTGKSTAALTKPHACCEKYPGARALMLRKTRVSLTESALVTFEDKVVPEGHPILAGPSRGARHAYRYTNGSTIVCGGLDRPGKIFSTEFDLIFVQEAIELDENGWEALTTRLRNGKIPYQQLLADTNPDRPTHWLKRRCDADRALMLESRHEDNPLIWDRARGEWTEVGRKYIATLDALTGPRKQRLRYGRWVQAEGVVYEGWNAAVHVIDRFVIPKDWLRYWVVDFGFTNPFVWSAYARDSDGRLYRYREIYRTRRLVEDHARWIVELTKGEPKPRAIICDHDAEARATLERHFGMPTTPAFKEVPVGIQAVAARLRPAGDGKPRLFFLRDSLDQRDAALHEAKKPCCTEEEFDGYVWNTGGGRKQGEEPEKRDDHGMDACQYLCANIERGWLWNGMLNRPLITSADMNRRDDDREEVVIGGYVDPDDPAGKRIIGGTRIVFDDADESDAWYRRR